MAVKKTESSGLKVEKVLFVEMTTIQEEREN
jgi:hypothetical protein